MLDGFDLDLIHGLEFNDNEEMGRSHLRRYRKLGNNNLEGIERHQDSFDSFVTRNLQKITDDLHQGIPASLHEQDANHQTSFFFFDNILEHIWRTFHGEVRTLETELQGTNHMLLRNPGRTMIAHGMFNDIEQLRNFLNRYTPLAIIRLQEISQRRNDLESHYNDFARAVNRIMRDIEWNKPLKGKCGWERGFWSIR